MAGGDYVLKGKEMVVAYTPSILEERGKKLLKREYEVNTVHKGIRRSIPYPQSTVREATRSITYHKTHSVRGEGARNVTP